MFGRFGRRRLMELRSHKRRKEDTIDISVVLEEALVLEVRCEMERKRLETLIDQQLQEEAWRYRLSIQDTREATIILWYISRPIVRWT